MRVAMEAGTHSPWVSRLLKRLGHEVLVANPRKSGPSPAANRKTTATMPSSWPASPPTIPSFCLRLSTAARAPAGSESDPRSGHAGSGSHHDHQCGPRAGQKRRWRLPSCSTESFAERTRAAIPPPLSEVATPLVRQIGMLTAQIELMDKQIDQLIRNIPSFRVNTTLEWGRVAACYVLTLDSPDVLGDNRQAGAFLRFVRGRASRASPTPSDASRKPATPTCAVCWCSRPNISWAASVPTRHCVVGA